MSAKTDFLNYTGGFFDGEGCIDLNPAGGRLRPRVRVGQNDTLQLNKFKGLFGGAIYKLNGSSKMSKYISFSWELHGDNAIAFLKTIVPFLISKKKQATALINAKCYTKELNDNLKNLKRNTYTLRRSAYA